MWQHKAKGSLGQENGARNTKIGGQENVIVKTVQDQRQARHRTKRIGSLLGTMKRNSELWGNPIVPGSGMAKRWRVCIALTCWADNDQSAK